MCDLVIGSSQTRCACAPFDSVDNVLRQPGVRVQTIAERERLEKEEEELQKRNEQRLAARKVR